MICIHGTPITPNSELIKLSGRNFCVSHAARSQLKLAATAGDVLMLDNGAFSVWKRGFSPDWDRYYEWVSPFVDRPRTFAIIPDVIVGSEEDNDDLLRKWPFGTFGVPVWHMHEDIDRLMRLVEAWPRVAIGSSGQFASVGTLSWHERMVDSWNAIGEGTPPVIHMLRGLSLSGGIYPFSSADSTDLARNHTRKRRGVDVVDVANRWDERAAGTAKKWKRTKIIKGKGWFGFE